MFPPSLGRAVDGSNRWLETIAERFRPNEGATFDAQEFCGRRPRYLAVGKGVGPLVSPEEGKRRPGAAPRRIPVENWARPLAYASENERHMGISQTVLEQWLERCEVIGLPAENGIVFPFEQFLDGSVIRGISDVLKIVGHSASAWRCLISPKPSIGGIPLDLLKEGKIEIVIGG